MEVQECVLYGSILTANEELLRERLQGLCDPVAVPFREQEWMFDLMQEGKSHVQVRMRRSMDKKEKTFQLRYIGKPEADPQCPCSVRKTIDTLVHSEDIMSFMKELGFRSQQEQLLDGVMFTKGRLKCVLQRIKKLASTQPTVMQEPQQVTGSTLVELNLAVQPGEHYRQVAKTLVDFGEQLKPLVVVERIDL